MPGLLIAGLLVDVPGATVLSPGDEPWVRMDARDYRKRSTTWLRQITPHTTKGIWPQRIVPGRPPNQGTRAEQVARYWSNNTQPGGAPLIVDGDLISCLVDLFKFETYHATKCNPWSCGIEMVQEPDGTIYESTLDTTVRLILVLSDILGIPLQGHSKPYRSNTIIEWLKYGGPNVVGLFGHNQSAWMFPEWYPQKDYARLIKAYPNGYADRGRGDPGDEIMVRLRAAGMMTFDIDAGGELVYWRKVQQHLNAEHGEKLTADGVCGPGTVAALRRAGLWNGGVFVEVPIA